MHTHTNAIEDIQKTQEATRALALAHANAHAHTSADTHTHTHTHAHTHAHATADVSLASSAQKEDIAHEKMTVDTNHEAKKAQKIGLSETMINAGDENTKNPVLSLPDIDKTVLSQIDSSITNDEGLSSTLVASRQNKGLTQNEQTQAGMSSCANDQEESLLALLSSVASDQRSLSQRQSRELAIDNPNTAKSNLKRQHKSKQRGNSMGSATENQKRGKHLLDAATDSAQKLRRNSKQSKMLGMQQVPADASENVIEDQPKALTLRDIINQAVSMSGKTPVDSLAKITSLTSEENIELLDNLHNDPYIADDSSVSRAQSAGLSGPQLVMDEHGQLTVNQDSLLIEAPSMRTQYSSVLEETGSSFNPYSVNKPRGERWSQSETFRFYRCLSQFGMNWEFIAQVFDRPRQHIKNKFKREERLHPHLVDMALKSRLPIDVEEFERSVARTVAQIDVTLKQELIENSTLIPGSAEAIADGQEADGDIEPIYREGDDLYDDIPGICHDGEELNA